MPIDLSAFHNEGNSSQSVDVFEWVAGDGDDVGVVAGLELADFVFPG